MESPGGSRASAAAIDVTLSPPNQGLGSGVNTRHTRPVYGRRIHRRIATDYDVRLQLMMSPMDQAPFRSTSQTIFSVFGGSIV
jgi:hypothetical protein